jgi:hypothetical protein
MGHVGWGSLLFCNPLNQNPLPMPHYDDLTEYVYGDCSQAGLVNVGWLDSKHPFNRGRVDMEIVIKIGELCKNPVNRKRGYQKCEMCAEYPIRELAGPGGQSLTLGDGEIRVPGQAKAYASPTLIYHYILRHSYRPPEEFLEAVKSMGPTAQGTPTYITALAPATLSGTTNSLNC